MKTIGIAGHLGHKSLFALYKLMNEYLQMQYGQRLLDVEGLQEKLQGLCQRCIDSVSQIVKFFRHKRSSQLTRLTMGYAVNIPQPK